jgi:hypothetical protein
VAALNFTLSEYTVDGIFCSLSLNQLMGKHLVHCY